MPSFSISPTMAPFTGRRTASASTVVSGRKMAAIAHSGGNVEELTTGLESAPMSGHPMFRAHGIVSIPENSDPAALTSAIEGLGGDLTVDVSA